MSIVALGQLVVPMLIFLYFGFTASRRYWMVADRPTVTCGHAFPGHVEVAGQAQLPAGRTLISPVSGEECVYLKWHLVDHGGNGGRTADGKRRNNSTQAMATKADFDVVDDSGRVSVSLGKGTPETS